MPPPRSFLTLLLRLFVSLIMAGFLVLGGLMFIVAMVMLAVGEKSRSWTSVSCRVLSSSIETPKNFNAEDLVFPFLVSYEYEVNGKKYSGNTFSFNYTAPRDCYESTMLVSRYPAGTLTTCLVDPTDPSQSVLAKPDHPLMPVAGMLIPLGFILVGAGGLYFIWGPPGPDGKNFLSRRINFLAGSFSGLILVAGIGLFHGSMVVARQRDQAALKWPQVACVIDGSGVQTPGQQSSHLRRSRTIYSLAVLFEYSVNGHAYKSSRYSLGGFSGDDAEVHRIQSGPLAPGRHTICFVNPLDPADAVLERSHGSAYWIEGAFSCLFILVGGLGLAISIQNARRRRLARN